MIENVPEFQRSAQFGRLLQLMDADPELSDYGYAYGVLHAADYGVPQSRRRGILMAVRGVEEVPWPPPPTHGPRRRASVSHGARRDRRPTRRDRWFRRQPSTATVDQLLHFGRRPRPESLQRYRAIPGGRQPLRPRPERARPAPAVLGREADRHDGRDGPAVVGPAVA